MKSHHDTIADIYRSLSRNLPDRDCQFAIQALADVMRDLAVEHYGDSSAARKLAVAALRQAFATEVSEVAVGLEDETQSPA